MWNNYAIMWMCDNVNVIYKILKGHRKRVISSAWDMSEGNTDKRWYRSLMMIKKVYNDLPSF